MKSAMLAAATSGGLNDSQIMAAVALVASAVDGPALMEIVLTENIHNGNRDI